MIRTSCTASLETLYLNTFSLYLSAIALKIAAEFMLISPEANSTDSCCFTAHLSPILSVCTAVHLTCLWATTHPAPRGEKGNPLRFKSLVIPVSKTKWQHVEK